MEFKSIKLEVKDDRSIVSLLNGDSVLGKITVSIGSQIEVSTEKEVIEKIPFMSPPQEDDPVKAVEEALFGKEDDPVKAVEEALFGKDDDLPSVPANTIRQEYVPPLDVKFKPEGVFPNSASEAQGVDNQFKILDGVSEGKEGENCITEAADDILQMSEDEIEAALTEVALAAVKVKRKIARRKGEVVVTPAPTVPWAPPSAKRADVTVVPVKHTVFVAPNKSIKKKSKPLKKKKKK
jgi:hypothetical protein